MCAVIEALRFQGWISVHVATRIRTEQHESTDALGVAHSVRHRDGAALRDAEQREAVETRRVDHGFEISHPHVDGIFRDVPVGQSASTRVVSHEATTRPRRSNNGRQTGVRQSYSMWLNQFAAFTNGLPVPTVAYARRTPSAVLQNRICCCIRTLAGAPCED